MQYHTRLRKRAYSNVKSEIIIIIINKDNNYIKRQNASHFFFWCHLQTFFSLFNGLHQI